MTIQTPEKHLDYLDKIHLISLHTQINGRDMLSYTEDVCCYEC